MGPNHCFWSLQQYFSLGQTSTASQSVMTEPSQDISYFQENTELLWWPVWTWWFTRIVLAGSRMLQFNAFLSGQTCIMVWSSPCIFSLTVFFYFFFSLSLTRELSRRRIITLGTDCVQNNQWYFKVKKQMETSSLKPSSQFNSLPEDRINPHFLRAFVVLKFTSDRDFITSFYKLFHSLIISYIWQIYTKSLVI